MNPTEWRHVWPVVIAACTWTSASSCAEIIDFNQWTLVEDPAHPNFTSSVDSASEVTLSATSGPIPSGTDIGYQSVDGTSLQTSTSGWAFDPALDFSVAADFDLSFGSPSGGFSIGMGIGEDRGGTNSAGVILGSLNGGFLVFAGGARINDTTQTPVSIPVVGQSAGRFIVSYEATSGNVLLGVSTNGDDIPEGTGVFSGIQNSWNDEALLVSLFARGDNGIVPWSSGTADVSFTDFHVVSGTPFAAAVPEPAGIVLLGPGLIGLIGYCSRRRSRRRV